MVVKGGKGNRKETASLGRSGKRKKTEKGGKEERKWRRNWSLDGGAEMVAKGGKRNKRETASLGWGRERRRIKEEKEFFLKIMEVKLVAR